MNPPLALKRVAPWLDESAWTAALALVGFALLTSRRIFIPIPLVWVGLLAGVIALIVVGRRYPAVPLYVLTAYVPFSHLVETKLGGETSILSLTTLLMLVVLVTLVWAHMAPHQTEQTHSTHVSWAVAVFALCSVVSLIRTSWLYGGWYVAHQLVPLIRWLIPFGLYALTRRMVRDPRTLKTMLAFMLVAVTIATLLAIRESMGRHGNFDHSRAGGIANHPNLLGAFFVYYMFLFAGLFLDAPKQLKSWGWLALFLLCARGVMVTFSRGAYFACAAGCLAMCWWRSKKLFAVAIALAAVVLLNPALLPAGIRYRLHMTVAKPSHEFSQSGDITAHLETSAAARIEIWRGALRMIQDHPWWGVGYGAFTSFLAHYTQGRIGYMNAHNSFLMVAAEMGLPTVVVFIILLGLIGAAARRLYRQTSDRLLKAMALGVLAGLPALIVANLFTVCIADQEVIGYFWMLAALIVCAVGFERRAMSALASANVVRDHE